MWCEMGFQCHLVPGGELVIYQRTHFPNAVVTLVIQQIFIRSGICFWVLSFFLSGLH